MIIIFQRSIVTVIVAACVFIVPSGCSAQNAVTTNDGTGSFVVDASPSDPVAQAVKRLTTSGWDESVAQKVVSLNESLLRIQAEVNPANYQQTVKLFENLGKEPEVRAVVAKWPETAGLLAGSANPTLLAKTIDRAGADYQWVANLYMTHAEREDSLRLASALQNNREVICKLAKMGVLCPEALFMFDRKGDGSEVYERWLNKLIDSQSSTDEINNTDEINKWVLLINRFGDRLLAKLNSDPAFRSGFESVYWPLFSRIVKEAHSKIMADLKNLMDASQSVVVYPITFEFVDQDALYFSDPAIWDVLMIKNQPVKIILHSGLMGGKLLFGDRDLKIEPYPENIREKVVELIVDHHEKSLQALAKHYADPRFHGILRKKVEAKILANVLLEITKAGPTSPQVIKKYFDMPEEGIRRVQDGQPEGLVTWIPLYYTLYKVPLDYYYGVDPTTMDLIQATADPLLMFLTIGGGKMVFAATKEAGKKIAQEAAEKGVKNFAVTTLREEALKKAAIKVTEEGLEQAVKQGLLNTRGTVFREMELLLAKTSDAILVVLKGGITWPALDITRPLQFAFQLTGGGRATWKRLTGLEARLFMRGDARVYIRLDNTAKAILGPKLGPVFNSVASDLKLGMVMESPPVKEGVEKGITQIALGAKESYEIWQKNASQWWLLNAIDPLALAH